MKKNKMFIELFIGWLFPGMCFVMKKNYARGFFIFVVLTITFIIGIILKGGVIWPVWNHRAEGFNIVNILTFLGQVGNGFLMTISLIINQLSISGHTIDSKVLSTVVQTLAGKESDPFFDVSSFFLLVSGSMNYFVLTNFYDQYYGKSNIKEK